MFLHNQSPCITCISIYTLPSSLHYRSRCSDRFTCYSSDPCHSSYLEEVTVTHTCICCVFCSLKCVGSHSSCQHTCWYQFYEQCVGCPIFFPCIRHVGHRYQANILLCSTSLLTSAQLSPFKCGMSLFLYCCVQNGCTWLIGRQCRDEE